MKSLWNLYYSLLNPYEISMVHPALRDRTPYRSTCKGVPVSRNRAAHGMVSITFAVFGGVDGGHEKKGKDRQKALIYKNKTMIDYIGYMQNLLFLGWYSLPNKRITFFQLTSDGYTFQPTSSDSSTAGAPRAPCCFGSWYDAPATGGPRGQRDNWVCESLVSVHYLMISYGFFHERDIKTASVDPDHRS